MNLKPSSLAPLSRSAINWKFRAPRLSCLVQVCVTQENRLGHNQRVPSDGKPGLGGPPESPDELQSRSRPLTSHTALDRTQGPQGPEACWVLPSVYLLPAAVPGRRYTPDSCVVNEYADKCTDRHYLAEPQVPQFIKSESWVRSSTRIWVYHNHLNAELWRECKP